MRKIPFVYLITICYGSIFIFNVTLDKPAGARANYIADLLNREKNGIEIQGEETEDLDILTYMSKYRVGKITAMNALDEIKNNYAANFEKSYYEGDAINYYYKLADADYYLVYEGLDSAQMCYVIHLYEFVVDEPETGIGHTVTYGWFGVDRLTGEIHDWTISSF